MVRAHSQSARMTPRIPTPLTAARGGGTNARDRDGPSRGATGAWEAIAMARLFNLKLFGLTLGGDDTSPTPVYSDQTLEATLGSADLLTVQLNIEGGSTDDTTVTIKYEHSNDARNWVEVSSQSLNLPTTASGIQKKIYAVEGSAATGFGAFGRFSLTADKPGAVVSVIVCGRSI